MSVSSGSVPFYDAGPVVSHDVSPDSSDRTRAMGPFFEKQTDTNGMSFMAVRPFYSRTNDLVKKRKLSEFVWPLGMIKEFQGELDWRFILAFGHNFEKANPDSRKRLWILPFLFNGTDINHEKYFAVFPIGGKVNEFLGRDKIVFALFPLYLFSSVNGVETTDVLFPFFSKTTGKDISRFRIFPFYMRSVTGDRARSESVMWPIWTSTKYDYPGSEGKGFILFPFYGHMKSTSAESWLYLPPFFRYTSGKKGKSGNFPWPLIQYSSANPEKFYIWPLWGYKDFQGIKTSFFLWPIVHSETIKDREREMNRFMILPVISYESQVVTEKNPNDSDVKENITARYFKLWPLGSYRREGDSYRFRILDLWPTKQMQGIERNWAPLWTLYSHNKVGENSEDELFWGIYHRVNKGENARNWSLFPIFSWNTDSAGCGKKEWNFLMGLFGYKRDDLLKSYRLLYFLKFNSKEKESKP
ncbi:MAG: hypothetical protein PHR77_15055 [Kiritimatiellae bacterium]|nr:hypothetical protein [Kiritimatiellia bacterium]MDD5521434.1 hypothetical protein [Kiritimatiellia bacterium]